MGPSHSKSSTIVLHANRSGNGSLLCCSNFNSSAASSPIKSGRCDSVCPIFTNTGPKRVIAALNSAPRVRFSGAQSSCFFQFFITRRPTRMIVANRPATCNGRRRKNLSNFGLSNSPRSASYASRRLLRRLFDLRPPLAIESLTRTILVPVVVIPSSSIASSTDDVVASSASAASTSSSPVAFARPRPRARARASLVAAQRSSARFSTARAPSRAPSATRRAPATATSPRPGRTRARRSRARVVADARASADAATADARWCACDIGRARGALRADAVDD